MHKLFSLFILFTYNIAPCFTVSAQSIQNISETIKMIEEEGKMLYRSEMASWNGTDIFFDNYSSKDNVGGYFSHNEEKRSKCVFYSKGDKPHVIGTIYFDNTFKPKNAEVKIEEREFSQQELELYTIRTKALEAVKTDSLFKSYTNTNLNLIPIIYNGQKKVYAITAPKQPGYVIFGNDYLINFDSENNITGKKQIHKNIIPIKYNEQYISDTSLHSHSTETGMLITPTDICTLMLYSPFTSWTEHYVISKDYVSIWNCKDNYLNIMPHAEWDKMQQTKGNKD